MSFEDNDQPKPLHSCAVMRYILMSVPEDCPTGLRHILTGLLAYMNMSNYTREDLKGNFFVEGSAAISQIASITGYKDREIRKKLRIWQQMGYVNWVRRDDNKGSDFRVFGHSQPDLVEEMDRPVAPAKSEQARIASRARWAKWRLAKAALPGGVWEVEGCGSSELNGSGNPDARCGIPDAEGAVPGHADSASGEPTLELRSGTFMSGKSSGTARASGDSPRVDNADSLRSRSNTHPIEASPRAPSGVYGNSRTHPAPRGKAVAPLHSGDSAARAAFEDPQDEGIREYLASLSPADKAKLERTRERERKEAERQARIARELRILEGRDLSQFED